MKNLIASLASLILGTLAYSCFAVEIVVPSGDIQPRELVVLEVRGLTDEQLVRSVVDWSPKDGVQVIPARSWSGSPQVFFSAKQPGKYSLSVKTGVSLSNAIVTAESAKVDAAMVAELKAIVGRIEAAYPPDATSVTITVVGSPEPPKPEPQPTPTPPQPTIPGDRFDNVAQRIDTAVLAIAKPDVFAKRIDYAKVFDEAAKRALAVGPDVQNVDQIVAYIRGEQSEFSEFAKVNELISDDGKKRWPMPNRDVLAEWYRCVAVGLRGVK